MPAPTFNLPVQGSAPNQYTTEEGLETAVNNLSVALDNMRITSTRITGLFELQNVGGTANAITADVNGALSDLDIGSTLLAKVVLFPQATNTGPVSLSITGDVVRPVLRSGGQQLEAGDFTPGAPVILRRSGATWRVFGTLRSDMSVNSGLIFATRQLAVDAGQLALFPAIGRIVTIEGSSIVYRGPGMTTDALFSTYPQWGVATRVDTAAAIRNSGVLPLVNIAGTGDAITADLHQSILDAGVTALSALSEVEYIPAQTNAAANPKITIAGVEYDIRGPNGEAWPAQGFVTGRSYKLRRRNLILRVSTGDVTSAEMTAERLARIRGVAQAGFVTLTNVAGTGDVITAEMPAGFADDGISAANLRGAQFVAVATNTGPVTLNIDGQGAVGVFTSQNANLPAGYIQPGRFYTLTKLANRWRITAGDVAKGDLDAEVAARAMADTHTLSGIAGTGDAISASLPVGVTLSGGMRLAFSPIAANTGAATISINGSAPIGIRDPMNAVLQAGDLLPGMRVAGTYTGSVLRLDPGMVTRKEIRDLTEAASAALSRTNHTGSQPISTIEGLRTSLTVLAQASAPRNRAEWLAARKVTVGWTADIEIGPEHAVTSDGSTVTSVIAGGVRGGTFAVQDAANPAIVLTGDGLQFQSGAWLRCIPAAFTAGKVMFVVDVTPGGSAASAMISTGSPEFSLESARFVAKFPGLNSAFDTRSDYVGRRQVVAMLADADAGMTMIVQRDGLIRGIARTMSPFNIPDFRVGRFGTYTIHRIWAWCVPPGADLPVSIDDAWSAMAEDQMRLGEKAIIHWGFGQSIYQGATVTGAANQVALEEPYRRVVKRVSGLVTATGAAVGATGAGNAAINQSVPATGLDIIGGGSETIQFATARARVRRLSQLGHDQPVMIVGTNGFGGQGIEEFDDDPASGTGSTVLWQNNRYWLEQARAVAVAQGLTPELGSLLVIHGTADKTAAQGWYLSRAKRVIDLHMAHAVNLFGHAPKLLMGQAGGDADTSNDGATGWAVCLDQIELIRHYDGLLIGPEYALPIEDDNVHPGWLARAGFGELADAAEDYHARGLAWNLLPPRESEITLEGNQVIMPWTLPHGSNMLMVPEPGKYDDYGGFCDHLGFTAPGRTITDVSLSGRICTITLDAAPTVLRYAMQVQNITGHRDPDGFGYTAHRGLIATDWRLDSVVAPGVVHRRWLPSYTWDFS